jgi:hypothetical protein
VDAVNPSQGVPLSTLELLELEGLIKRLEHLEKGASDVLAYIVLGVRLSLLKVAKAAVLVNEEVSDFSEPDAVCFDGEFEDVPDLHDYWDSLESIRARKGHG